MFYIVFTLGINWLYISSCTLLVTAILYASHFCLFWSTLGTLSSDEFPNRISPAWDALHILVQFPHSWFLIFLPGLSTVHFNSAVVASLFQVVSNESVLVAKLILYSIKMQLILE